MSYLAHVTDLIASEDEALSADDDREVVTETETASDFASDGVSGD